MTPFSEMWHDFVVNEPDPVSRGAGFVAFCVFTLLAAPLIVPAWILGGVLGWFVNKEQSK